MAENSNMPLAGELGLINYLQGLFSNKVANPNYTGASVPAPVLAPTMSGQDMQNIMTEFLRGNGQFLDQMRQQNLSGLYNSSTRNLVANDLTAQAALKASTANAGIQNQNAQILNTYNARVAAQQPKYLPNTQGGTGKAAAALGVAGLDWLLKNGLGGKGTETSKRTKKDPNAIDESGAYNQGTENPVEAIAGLMFGLDAGKAGQEIMDFAGNGLTGSLPELGTNTSLEIPSVPQGFDLGNIGGGILDNIDLPSLDLPDFDFELPDFDFFDIGSWFD